MIVSNMIILWYNKNKKEYRKLMEEKYLKSLELDKILNMLSEETSCEDAKRLAVDLKPSSNVQVVNDRLIETNDANMLSTRFGCPSFGKLKNIADSLTRASAGGLLTMRELLILGENLRVFRSLKEWESRCEQVKTSLTEKFNLIFPNKYLEERIFKSIISDEEMADEASPELSNIRRKIRAAASRVREQLDKLIRSNSYRNYLQDAVVTMRDSRFVVPVKVEHRNEVPGLVHDTSSSGSTLFIEPIAVVEANNDIRMLKSKERDEIERILFELSAKISNFAETINLSYEMCVQLNFIFAKSNLAYKMKAVTPKINQDGKINLKKARHPLISKKDVVPIDITLGIDFDTLVITGPNTGGKTVSLKTVGLLSLMTMCGLMIPVSDGSEISIFENILADIGDEQSIEQSLSTFSSHMINIVNILNLASPKSLILLDELGAGTDPVEGAALATAILERLKEKGAKIISTTHYAELKSYAILSSRVENACCEFDVSTLRPTYKLLIGLPGRSNAFTISSRLGISNDIILKAKKLLHEKDHTFEEVVRVLEEKRNIVEKRQLEVEQLKSEIESLKRDLLDQKTSFENNKQKLLSEAKKETEKIVSRTKAQATELMDQISRIKKDGPKLEDKTNIKQNLQNLIETADPVTKKNNRDYILPRKLKIGDDVLVVDINQKGEVLENQLDSKNILVQIGIIKTRVSIKNLRLINENVPKKKLPGSQSRKISSRATSKVTCELDLRGQTALEAIIELDRFIDTSVLNGVNQITVIHGKGTGTLRKEIHKHLKSHPSVKSFRLGVFGEGETGVTIIEIK